MISAQQPNFASQHHHRPHGMSSVRPRQERVRTTRQVPLTEEQFVASSLALVAHLSLRMRAQTHRQG